MSSSRLFLVGNLLFRPHKLPFNLSSNQFRSVSLRFRCFSGAAAAGAAPVDADSSQSPPVHPWPEWVTFVDRLKTKGYFLEEPPTANNGGPEMVYRDMNLVKDACLSFARDRYDVFKSLSLGDIQNLVERGCPNLLRKTVNSSKRLRAHVRLDEGDVCSTCDLRDSCDRAYVILKDAEAAARTVDVMRVLLFNALDPLVISGGEKPLGKELIDESARRVLTELVELSEKSPDPALPKPAAKGSLSRRERAMGLKNDEPSQHVGSNFSADWTCPKCNFVNFAKNEKCRECGEVPDERFVALEIQKGDWLCPQCNFVNFSRNPLCLKCKTEGPKRISLENIEMKKGDWNCPGCGFMNFSSNRQCLRCQEQRPKRQLNPGEWECPSCDFLNYRRNIVCKKCNCKRPREAAQRYEEHPWRRPS